MSGPLLETKLHIPKLRHGRVQRTRLVDLLGRAAESTLTLVSAPAGFGKTTLLVEWLDDRAGRSDRVAWVSLDPRDNDPVLFWSYVATALTAATGTAGAATLSLLREPRPEMNAVLTTLVNELAAVQAGTGPDPVVLVLDDYHHIETRDIHDGVTFFLEHLPPEVRLVLAGRADPALPLARLRARGELTEIRSADLRFTSEEAATYLNDVIGLALTPTDVAALESRTEGWIAALQLAGLSMHGRDDVSAFIEGFAGDDRYIVDYLAEEVLQRQPGPVRDFLLRTSILSRLSGPLCDAVTGGTDGKAMLAALERDNLFLLALDGRRQWYRYHQLFADVLQAHLLDERPADVAALHRRAGNWYEHSGEPAEAIRHALAAGDAGHAADLVERAIPPLRRARQDATLRRFLEALPEEVFAVRPVLSIAWAGALMVRGETQGVESRLRDAERWLDPLGGVWDGDLAGSRPPEMVVVDAEAFRAVPGAIELYRAGRALILGDVEGTMTHARRSLERAGADDHIARGAPAALLGLAYWTRGDLDTAHHWYAEAIESLGQAGHLTDVLGCTIAAADIRLAQGGLCDAMTTYQRALRLATESSATAIRGVADMQVGIAELLRERDELAAARERLATVTALGEHAGLPQNRYRSRVTMARILQAEGDFHRAIELLDEAELVYTGDFSPDVRPVAAVRAAIRAANGDVRNALRWVRERGLTVGDELSYLHEFEHLTLARVLLAQDAANRYAAEQQTADGGAERSAEVLPDALRLLERLLRAAESGRRPGSVLNVLVVQALGLSMAGARPAALSALRRALELAQPQDYVRTFADEGPQLAVLLRELVQQRVSVTYARRLLAAIDEESLVSASVLAPDAGAVSDMATAAPPTQPPIDQAFDEPINQLIDPLSDRELDVLRLLGTDLDGPDIARRLVISLNTVRSHTQHIYTKLGVKSRRAAVTRASELQLLSQPRR